MSYTNFIQKITATDGTTHDLLDSSASHFIRGTQTASTNVWTGPLPDGVTDYYDGLMVDYWLPFAGTSTAATLNLGGKGAKPVYRGNAATSGVTTHIAAKTVAHLTYVVDSGINSGNGAWIMSSYYDSDSNTVDRLRDSYFRPYAGEAVYRYKFVMQGADNRMYPITLTNQENTTQVAKVPTQVGLRPGRIWFYNTTTTVAAGGLFAANTLDEAYQTTAGAYNFNTSAPTYRMIYLRGTYNKTTDLFTLYKDNSSPCTSYYTYVPTNTANITLSSYFTSGYYYILLGGTYSTANYISLFPYNPLYYFDGTNLIPASTKVAQDTNTTYSDFTGATSSASGTHGLVPAPTSGKEDYVLAGDGTWENINTTATRTTTSYTFNIRLGDKTVTSQTINGPSDSGTGMMAGIMTGADKTKLNGIATGAEVNQNAFSTISVKEYASATTTVDIEADSKTDTFSIIAGNNMSITANSTDDSITLSPVFLIAGENNSGLMSADQASKLAGIEAGAEVNQNAFSNVKVGSTTIAADSKTDTLELVAGSNITLTPDATNDTVTISATSSGGGSDEKVKLTALTSGTTYYPLLGTGVGTATRQIDSTLGGLKYISTAGTSSAIGTAILQLGNATASGTANNEKGVARLYGTGATYYTDLVSGTPTANRTITLPNATGTLALNTVVTPGSSVSSGGLMSQADKTRLDDIPEHVELTQAEYDALSTAEKNNGTVYFITDVDDTVGINKPIGLSDTSWITFNGSWTAPDNGIAVIRVQKNSTAGNGTFYLKDTTASTNGIFYISCTFPANYQNTGMFIVEKGHTYETEFTSNNFTGIWIRLYPWNF